VKGCGEAGAIGSPATVVNAVIDALQRGGMTHVTHIDMPLTPCRVWTAMNG
jgi:carbon-monoxide dehydrogenase large subunit